MSPLMAIASVLAVGTGGAIGALARWGTSRMSLRLELDREGVGIPWPTLVVNILACFGMGLLVTWFGASADGRGRLAYLLLATGIIGSLSVLSTVALDAVTLLRRGAPVLALGYLLITAGGSLAALWLGLVIAA